MIRKLDGVTTLLLATIFTTFLLFSCAAKQAAREIIVTVPVNYTGEISLDPCSSHSSAEVVVDASGSGATSACPQPGETVTLRVVKEGVSYTVPSNDVIIQRAGDGIPVAIKARVPEH